MVSEDKKFEKLSNWQVMKNLYEIWVFITTIAVLVAIKKFKESAEEDQIVKKTTKREVKMLSVLKDKSVVRMIEAFKR